MVLQIYSKIFLVDIKIFFLQMHCFLRVTKKKKKKKKVPHFFLFIFPCPDDRVL